MIVMSVIVVSFVAFCSLLLFWGIGVCRVWGFSRRRGTFSGSRFWDSGSSAGTPQWRMLNGVLQALRVKGLGV